MPSTTPSTLRRRDLRHTRPRWRRRASTALRSVLRPAWCFVRQVAVRAMARWLSELLPPPDAALVWMEGLLHLLSELIRALLG